MRTLAVLLLTAAPAFAEGQLFIYTWGEYTPPDLVAKFEKEFGVKVQIDSYDSMETMIAKPWSFTLIRAHPQLGFSLAPRVIRALVSRSIGRRPCPRRRL